AAEPPGRGATEPPGQYAEPGPDGVDGAGTNIVAVVPELLDAVTELTVAADGPVGTAVLLGALADLVVTHLPAAERHADVLARSAHAIEALLEACDDPVGTSAAFFDALDPEQRYGVIPWLGPTGAAALEQLDAEAGS
ncbi:MAG: hypothetical protein ACP5P9_09435, partial [Acidimicrobiales bacterium]